MQTDRSHGLFPERDTVPGGPGEPGCLETRRSATGHGYVGDELVAV
jgi:hypothetical protein